MRDVAVAVAIAITTKSNMAEYLEHRKIVGLEGALDSKQTNKTRV